MSGVGLRCANPTKKLRYHEMKMIPGINAYYGDSSAVLVVDGKLVAAVEEGRVRRIKHKRFSPAQRVPE